MVVCALVQPWALAAATETTDMQASSMTASVTTRRAAAQADVLWSRNVDQRRTNCIWATRSWPRRATWRTPATRASRRRALALGLEEPGQVPWAKQGLITRSLLTGMKRPLRIQRLRGA